MRTEGCGDNCCPGVLQSTSTHTPFFLNDSLISSSRGGESFLTCALFFPFFVRGEIVRIRRFIPFHSRMRIILLAPAPPGSHPPTFFRPHTFHPPATSGHYDFGTKFTKLWHFSNHSYANIVQRERVDEEELSGVCNVFCRILHPGDKGRAAG